MILSQILFSSCGTGKAVFFSDPAEHKEVVAEEEKDQEEEEVPEVAVEEVGAEGEEEEEGGDAQGHRVEDRNEFLQKRL